MWVCVVVSVAVEQKHTKAPAHKYSAQVWFFTHISLSLELCEFYVLELFATHEKSLQCIARCILASEYVCTIFVFI